MRKKLGLVAVLALLLSAAGGSLALAGDSSGDDGTRTIHLTAKAVQETEVDVGEQGFGQGDYFVFGDDLFRDGEKVGTDGGTCTFVRVEEASATANCVVTLSLPKGQVTVQGLVTFAGEGDAAPFVVAVTGGTGAYRTAHGEVEVDPNGDEERLTLKLIL